MTIESMTDIEPSGCRVGGLRRARPAAIEQGVVTVVVVAILALLSLIATRILITSSIENIRVGSYGQGINATLYAAEVAMKDAISDISVDGLSQQSDWSSYTDMGSKILSSANGSVSKTYQMDYCIAFVESRDDRHIYRLYARATSGSIAEQTTDGLFEATVSQLLSVDITNTTAYVITSTWTDTLMWQGTC